MLIELNGKQIEISENSNAFSLFEKNNSENNLFGVLINGKTKDLETVLKKDDKIIFLNFKKEEGSYLFWHTSAHILAQAILRLYPEAQPTIGPPIKEGFYYDFANLKISEDDFPKIEKEIFKIIKENHKTRRIEYKIKQDALDVFKNNPYKKELIEEFRENLSAYQQGEFLDLCRGPHLPQLNLVKAFKILKVSGSYWRGDAKKTQLTRIYAISYPTKQQLKEYFNLLQEAQKRDHRILGKKLNLFSFQKEAPGMPLFHPKGIIIWNKIMNFWRKCHESTYEEIKTPIMLSQDLWVTSGHWENYKENMYFTKIDEIEYAIKPMNCPGCMLYYNSSQHSYKQLPLRIAELGHVHRHELSGTLGGLFRVRAFHQDDAHIFMKESDIENEILGVLQLSQKIYSCFGLEFNLELSTKPDRSIGSDRQWKIATEGLESALIKGQYKYKINEGDGAFYGPKIDMHIRDALKRTWQCGTIQLDMTLPERFKISYVDKHGKKKEPIMIHRTILGSIERFIAILIEHFSGKFPFWLSPNQIKLLTVADRHLPFAKKIYQKLLTENWIVEIDTSAESISKKVRLAKITKWNYIFVIGDKEENEQSFSIRNQDNIQYSGIKLEEFIKKVTQEEQSKSLVSSEF